MNAPSQAAMLQGNGLPPGDADASARYRHAQTMLSAGPWGRRDAAGPVGALPWHVVEGLDADTLSDLPAPAPPPRRPWWRRVFRGKRSAPLSPTPPPVAPAPLPDTRREKPPRRRRSFLRSLVYATVLAALAFAAFVVHVIVDTGISRDDVIARAHSPRVELVPVRHAGPSGRPYDAAMIAPLYLPQGEPVPDYVATAFIVAEDRKFRWHPGFDPLRTPFAIVNELRRLVGGRVPQLGGSTITMQLVKNVYLSRDKSPLRKMKEVVLAVAIEYWFTKDEILRMYLDNISFGNGQDGIEAAARHYFGRSVGYGASSSRISLFQAALLARTVRSPSVKNPDDNAVVLGREAKRLVLTMAKQGYVTKALAERVLATPMLKPGQRHFSIRPNFFRDYALREGVPAAIAGSDHRLVVGLTLEPEAQLYADAAMADLAREGQASGYDWAAIVVMTPDGSVAAMSVGGDLGSAKGFNPASDGRRSYGSLLKPFMALCALEKGATLRTRLSDVPREFRPGWVPRNSDGRYLGTVTLVQALAQSRNPPFVELFDRFGYACFENALKRFRFNGQLTKEPGVVLGTGAASLVDMVSLYAGLAARGRTVEPHSIAYAREASGSLLFKVEAKDGRAVIADKTRCALVDMLRAAVGSGGSGRRASWGAPLAGKTGTSSDNRDAWFIGFTDEYVAGVWIGRRAATPPSHPMGGGDLPARTFHTVMRNLHLSRPPSTFGCAPAVALDAPPR